jgi:hypothetical protein
MRGVAFSGRAASGKSSLASAVRDLLSHCGRPALVVSFADAIKEEVWEQYGLRKGDLGGREAIIKHGEYRRALDPLYWCRKIDPTLKSAQADGSFVVVDDLRFRVEASFLRARDFHLCRCVAPAWLRMKRLEETGQDPSFALSTHPSETQLAGWDGFDTRIYRGGGPGYTALDRAETLLSLLDKRGEEDTVPLPLP